MYIDSPEKLLKNTPTNTPIFEQMSLFEVKLLAEVAKWQTH